VDPLIEHYFPTKEVSEESQRERAVISPPPFYLHLWWARRPLIASRAVAAALAVNTDGPPSKDFIAEFLRAIRLVPKRERPAYNYDPDREWIWRHSDVRESALLDPFAGGGSIPFEALRLGFKKVVAVEYNPVAYVILKATLEYPLKYKKKLVKDVERWAKWLVEKVVEEVKDFFPPHPEKGHPTNYIWVRVYRCPDGKPVPSLSNPILSNRDGIALKFDGHDASGSPIIEVVKVKNTEKAKKELTTIRRKKLNCLTATLDSKDLQRQYKEAMKKWEEEGLYGRHPAVLAAVKYEDGTYGKPTEEMLRGYELAEKRLQERWEELVAEDLIPTEKIEEGVEVVRMHLNGIDRFYKLFNARQLLLHALMVKYIRKAYQEMLKEGMDEEYAKAVVTYLALGHGKLLDYNSVITTWDPHDKGSIRDTFSRHSYSFGDDFAEGNPLSSSSLRWVFFSNTGVVKALERIVSLLANTRSEVEIILGDAAEPATYAGLDGVQYVVADPPYYNNVQYAELSDFFYVWMKRSIGELYPEAFAWETVPKDAEMVVNKVRGRDSKWFEERLRQTLELAQDLGAGRLAIMYAHRSSEGLYALFSALIKGGWKPVGVWSVASEQPKSIHIAGKAAVRSMLIIGAVPRESSRTCFWDASFTSKMEREVKETVVRALKLGLSLVDAVMAGIGAAFRVAGDCEKLKHPDGRDADIKDIIDFASKVSTKTVTEEVLKAQLDPATTMYFLARAVYGEPEFDELRRLSYATGYDYEKFINKFTKGTKNKKEKKVYIIKSLDEVATDKAESLIEALARAVKAFLIGGIDRAVGELKKEGFALDRTLCRLVELLREDSEGDERKALQGIYAACIQRNVLEERASQQKLTDFAG